jgi:hypothetical protein
MVAVRSVDRCSTWACACCRAWVVYAASTRTHENDERWTQIGTPDLSTHSRISSLLKSTVQYIDIIIWAVDADKLHRLLVSKTSTFAPSYRITAFPRFFISFELPNILPGAPFSANFRVNRQGQHLWEPPIMHQKMGGRFFVILK